MPSWLASVRSWFTGSSHDAPDGRHVLPRVPRVVEMDDFEPPMARDVPPRKHVEALMTLFQIEGRTGAVPHWEWVSNYPETAWVNGFREIPERTLLRHLGIVCAKTRQMVRHEDGKWARAICYVVPDVPRRRGHLTVIPNGDVDDIPWPELPKRARTGSSHAQA
jgi:hypothetical protein